MEDLSDWLDAHMVVHVKAGVDAYPILESLWQGHLGGPFDLRIELIKLLEPQTVILIASDGNMAQLALWRH